MFARFNEILSMALEYIKETKTYGDNMKAVNPPQTQFAGEGRGGDSIMNFVFFCFFNHMVMIIKRTVSMTTYTDGL